MHTEPIRLQCSGSPERMRAQALVAVQCAPAKEGESKKQPMFSINAYNGGLMHPQWAYRDAPMVIDLAGAKAAEPIAVLLDHWESAIVGQSTLVRIAESRVDIDGIVTGDWENPDEPACKVVTHAKNGFVWKASIGGVVNRTEFVEAGVAVRVNGRDFVGPLYVARSFVLDEVSLLSIPADKSTSAKIAASAAKENQMDFHDWLKAAGFDPANLTDTQRDTLNKQFKAEASAAAALKAAQQSGQPTPAEDVLAPMKAKRERQIAIRAAMKRLAEKHPDRIDMIETAGNCALAEDWTPERFELHCYQELPAHVNNAPRAATSSGDGVTTEILEAALCKSARLDQQILEKTYGDRILSAADRAFRRGLTIGELLIRAARSRGHENLHVRDTGELLRAAFDDRGLRAAGASSIDVSGILSNVANKFLVMYFMAVESAWRKIAAIRNVNDFKTITSYSMVGDSEYKLVAPGGEIKSGSLSEKGYSNKADTYGRLFSLDRRDIVNDDLGAFNSITKRLGRGAALKLNSVFWAEFMDNASFFSSGNANYISGGTTNLGIDGLTQGVTTFKKLKDPNNNPLGTSPKFLVVPVALEVIADQIYNSLELRELQTTTANTAAKSYGTHNPHARKYEPVPTSYLTDSDVAWYLLADPNELPVIEVAFLNGVEVPTVESTAADFDNLGMKFRGYHDFGVTKQEFRGGVKSKGQA